MKHDPPSGQLGLFDERPIPRRRRTLAPKAFRFNGSDYDQARDSVRLTGQILRVWNVMVDGRWRTLEQISALTRDPPASVSAQLRHLRKKRFGEHQVEKRNRGNGLFEYRVIASSPTLHHDDSR
jgi:hypothetical protein